ncbi:MAG: hypothetical protein Q8927_21085 [Bacteroidota bacterium]|nr:hypothetical protein [Bacteroidota bacterium]MDP4218698.1 hypothetical protein [Bacteroidota bacterium]MDP4244915.1 hypothetical protein [Bacteroidota bacterium]MDP4256019.1 hypothetical protein [Bacteroidota bacterium]MDP4257585.1 hypothetical protein [Bacteroidota bacterium]
MTDIQQKQPAGNAANWDPEKKKVPETLNVLTILTYIGCGLGLIFSVYGFFTAQATYELMLQKQGSLDNLPDFAKKMMGPEMLEMYHKMFENRIPILLLALIGYVLCFYGATQMRQRKKMGFSLYVIGEIVPVVALFIFIGTGAMIGVTLVTSLIIPAVFIILYATQLKHLS